MLLLPLLLISPIRAAASHYVEPPAPFGVAKSSKPLPPEFPRPKDTVIDQSMPLKQQQILTKLKALDYQAVIDWEVEREDRKELVWPAPAGFIPKAKGRKIELRLIPRTRTLRPGESFWYRIELQNVGSEEVTVRNVPFLKHGELDRSQFQFTVTDPDGKSEDILLGTKASYLNRGVDWPQVHLTTAEVENMEAMEDDDCVILAQSHGEQDPYKRYRPKVPDWSRLSEAERDRAWEEWNYRQDRPYNLTVRLLPGETLRSSPWQFHTCKDIYAREDKGLPAFPPPADGFRELKTPYPFEKPGHYRIMVVFNDPLPKPPDETHIQHMAKRGVSRGDLMEMYEDEKKDFFGIVESNTVELRRLP